MYVGHKRRVQKKNTTLAAPMMIVGVRLTAKDRPQLTIVELIFDVSNDRSSTDPAEKA